MALFFASSLALLLLAFGPGASEGQENFLDFSYSSGSEGFSRADESYWPARAAYPACDGCVNCAFCPKCHLHIPPGYKLYKDLGYYKLHHESKYWMAAKDACAQEGGYLAVVDSKKEMAFVDKIAKEYKYQWISLGFFDVHKNGTYWTVLDKPMTYFGWAPGEPDDVGRKNCGSYWGGGLNDLPCVQRTPDPFLCELFP